MKSIFSLAVLMFAASSYADSLRCGSQLISTGDSKGTVEQKCGSPASTDSFCKPSAQTSQSSSDRNQECIRVDVWRYNRGAGQLGAEVSFQQGEVTAIKNTDRE